MTTTYEISNSGLTSHKMSANILVRLLYDGTPVRAGYNPERFGETLGDGLTRRIGRTRSLTRHDQSRSQLKRSAMRHSPGTGTSRGLATSQRRDVTLAHACKTRIRREQSIPRLTAPVQIRRETRDSDVSLSRGNATARSQVRAALIHSPSDHEEIRMTQTRIVERFLTSTDVDERKTFGRMASLQEREALGVLLEKYRKTKQRTTVKSEAWYNADAMITRVCDALYAGRTIDPMQTLDESCSEGEA